MEKAELKELLRESTEKALIELGKILDKNNSLYNEFIILWKRHDDVERKIRLGIIGHQEAGIENNQITDGLLKLIDRIQTLDEAIISDINEKKEILIEEAIEWLSNALMGRGVYKEEENIEGGTKSSHTINRVEISSKGDFLIGKTYGYNSYKNYDGDSCRIWDSEEVLYISGMLHHVGNVIIETINDIDDVFWVKCTATNYKKIFRLASFQTRETIYKEGKVEENKDEYKSEFKFPFDNYEFALKVKNAIDYLSIYFGRKEDAF